MKTNSVVKVVVHTEISAPFRRPYNLPTHTFEVKEGLCTIEDGATGEKLVMRADEMAAFGDVLWDVIASYREHVEAGE